MFTERSKGKKALETVVVIIAVIAALCTCFLAASPNIITPKGVRYGLYGVSEGTPDGVIKPGDGVLADNKEKPSSSDYILVETQDGRIKAVKGGQSGAPGAVKAVYVIDYLGTVAVFLYGIRFFVWGFWGALAAAYIVIKATYPARASKKHRKTLTDAFEYYGKIYGGKDTSSDE